MALELKKAFIGLQTNAIDAQLEVKLPDLQTEQLHWIEKHLPVKEIMTWLDEINMYDGVEE